MNSVSKLIVTPYTTVVPRAGISFCLFSMYGYPKRPIIQIQMSEHWLYKMGGKLIWSPNRRRLIRDIGTAI